MTAGSLVQLRQQQDQDSVVLMYVLMMTNVQYNICGISVENFYNLFVSLWSVSNAQDLFVCVHFLHIVHLISDHAGGLAT